MRIDRQVGQPVRQAVRFAAYMDIIDTLEAALKLLGPPMEGFQSRISDAVLAGHLPNDQFRVSSDLDLLSSEFSCIARWTSAGGRFW